MSVTEKKVVDGMALSNDGKSIRLLIADHLEWDDEYHHLIELQEKINSYIAFWEGQQYRKAYNDVLVEYAVFEIHFLHEPSKNGVLFLEQVQKQVRETGIILEIHITGGEK